MDIETPTAEQLPQIRRITSLEDIRRIIPPKPIIPPRKEIKPPGKPKFSIRFFIIGLLFFVILGISFTIIYRYDRLNKLSKQLYQISVKLKDRIYILKDGLKDSNKIKNKLLASRRGLIGNYFNLSSRYKILQFNIDEYRDASSKISLTRQYKIGLLEGDLRVAYARAEAVKAQDEILAKELKEKVEYIHELTSKLVKSIDEQKLLVNQNLQLKREIETAKSHSEVKDVNQ